MPACVLCSVNGDEKGGKEELLSSSGVVHVNGSRLLATGRRVSHPTKEEVGYGISIPNSFLCKVKYDRNSLGFVAPSFMGVALHANARLHWCMEQC